MTPTPLNEDALDKEAKLKNQIQLLAEQHGYPEIKYHTSFTEKPHFFLKTKLDDAISKQAFAIYALVFAPVTP
jgi:hypothetical protein